MGAILNFYDKRGKFYFGSLTNFDEVDADIYLFCTTYSSNVPEGTVLAPELAPSFNLLLQKKAWLDQNILDQRFDDFKELYLKEIADREDYVKAIEIIEGYIRDGMKVVLFDDCNLGKQCHLTVLKEYLKNKGYRVEDIKINPNQSLYTANRW